MKPDYAFLSLLFFLSCTSGTKPQSEDSDTMLVTKGQWPNYGNDAGGMRHSPLDEVNRENVKSLQVAWTFRTGELATYKGTGLDSKAAFEATPLMVDGVLYFPTATNRIFAIDAATGDERWRYDPHIDRQGDYSEVTSRGVSKWVDPDNSSMRIFAGTIDGFLIALNAATGKPINSFGKDGRVDLTVGVGHIQVTSPPAVINGLVVVGSAIGDNHRIDYPRGVVRAFDARTGALKWAWDPIPSDPVDPAHDSWKGQKAQRTGAANAWAPIAADPDRDLVFVPTASPSVDYYGGERLGDNVYANSIVALKASTGKVVWHFQTVHHDLWDYDNPAEPVLFDLERDDAQIPAVALVTKMGHTFVMNRETGEQLFPVEERPVPASDIPGEQASPTQPFPSQLPLLGMRRVTPDDAWGPTPQLIDSARARISRHVNKGIFTPPSLQGSMMTPGNVGGMNWSGASYDPANHLLIANTNRLVALITLFPKDSNTWTSVRSNTLRAEIGLMEGTPYMMSREYLFTATENGLLMQTKPPWGTLAAIDMLSGQLKWEVPLGFMIDPRKFPEAPQWGSISLGGAMTTAGGLTFIAGTFDGFLRAFETSTGKLLWQDRLPAGGQATPMTYTWEGKQYIVIAAGGHGKLGTPLGDYVVAYALQ